MFIVVLTPIALSRTAVQGVLTIFVYAIGMSILLIVISPVGGATGKKIREKVNISGELAGRAIGIAMIAIGSYFLYLAFG